MFPGPAPREFRRPSAVAVLIGPKLNMETSASECPVKFRPVKACAVFNNQQPMFPGEIHDIAKRLHRSEQMGHENRPGFWRDCASNAARSIAR